jgi:hypothetical protein
MGYYLISSQPRNVAIGKKIANNRLIFFLWLRNSSDNSGPTSIADLNRDCLVFENCASMVSRTLGRNFG